MVLVLLVCVGDSFLFRGISRGGNSMISSSVYRQRLYSGTKTQDAVKKLIVSEAQQGKESTGTSPGNSRYNLTFLNNIVFRKKDYEKKNKQRR